MQNQTVATIGACIDNLSLSTGNGQAHLVRACHLGIILFHRLDKKIKFIKNVLKLYRLGVPYSFIKKSVI